MRKKIGECLIQAGLITEHDLQSALAEHKRTGERVGAVLVRMKLATEKQIAKALAFQLGFPYVNLAENPPDPAAVALIPKEVALKRVCVAVALEKNLLTVAMSDPLLFSLVQDLEFQTGYRIKQVVATRGDILEAIESSVGVFRMQSMNQSLIALLAHQKITYQDAMALSSDPDDLSLKLRKLFPQIEERVREGGDMAPSYSDFSQITELMDVKRLYEEQEVQWRQRISDKDEEMDNLRHDIELLRQQLTQSQSSRGQFDEDVARMRAENERLRADAQAKINQLQERIKELNQKLMAVQGAPPRR